MSTHEQNTPEHLYDGVYRACVVRVCGHTHKGPSYNGRSAALRYGDRVLKSGVCGVCRRP